MIEIVISNTAVINSIDIRTVVFTDNKRYSCCLLHLLMLEHDVVASLTLVLLMLHLVMINLLLMNSYRSLMINNTTSHLMLLLLLFKGLLLLATLKLKRSCSCL